jgi:hypothetical protein
MRVKITAAHISAGIPGSPDGCPLALALKDKIFPGGGLIRIGRTTGLVGWRYHLDLGTAARKFIDAFDAGLRVEPCTVTLQVPWGFSWRRLARKGRKQS